MFFSGLYFRKNRKNKLNQTKNWRNYKSRRKKYCSTLFDFVQLQTNKFAAYILWHVSHWFAVRVIVSKLSARERYNCSVSTYRYYSIFFFVFFVFRLRWLIGWHIAAVTATAALTSFHISFLLLLRLIFGLFITWYLTQFGKKWFVLL